jgi:hypothetical protein
MGLAMAQDSVDPLEKIIAVGVVPENLPALNPLNDNVMQRPGASILALRGMIFK